MIDDRQFFIGREKIQRDDWKSVSLLGNMWISYQEKMNVTINNDGSCVILGNAWQVDPEQDSPSSIINSWNSNTLEAEIYNQEESWCGKYVLIVGSRIFQDCASLIPTFYDQQGNLSSSLRLLAEKNGGGIRFPKIKHGIGTNYIPGPCTMYPGIRKILASQVYRIIPGQVGEIYERPLLPKGIREYKGEKTVEEFSRYFIHSLQEMRTQLAGSFKVALTGGYDSRTLLSLIDRSGVDYNCFTYETEFMHGGGDVEIPPMLCKLTGKPYHYYPLHKGSYDKEKECEFLSHAAGMERDGNLYAYSHGTMDEIVDGSDSVILYNGIWEIAIEYFTYHSKGMKKDPTDIDDLLTAFSDVRYDEVKMQSLREWLDWIHNSKYSKLMKDTNRFYWEERDGCWMSYIGQAMDVIDHCQMIQPCNSRLFLSYLFSWPEEMRITKSHQIEIIRYNRPEFLNVPFTDDYPKAKRSFVTKVMGRLKRYWYFTKWYGLKWIK